MNGAPPNRRAEVALDGGELLPRRAADAPGDVGARAQRRRGHRRLGRRRRWRARRRVAARDRARGLGVGRSPPLIGARARWRPRTGGAHRDRRRAPLGAVRAVQPPRGGFERCRAAAEALLPPPSAEARAGLRTAHAYRSPWRRAGGAPTPACAARAAAPAVQPRRTAALRRSARRGAARSAFADRGGARCGSDGVRRAGAHGVVGNDRARAMCASRAARPRGGGAGGAARGAAMRTGVGPARTSAADEQRTRRRSSARSARAAIVWQRRRAAAHVRRVLCGVRRALGAGSATRRARPRRRAISLAVTAALRVAIFAKCASPIPPPAGPRRAVARSARLGRARRRPKSCARPRVDATRRRRTHRPLVAGAHAWRRGPDRGYGRTPRRRGPSERASLQAPLRGRSGGVPAARPDQRPPARGRRRACLRRRERGARGLRVAASRTARAPRRRTRRRPPTSARSRRGARCAGASAGRLRRRTRKARERSPHRRSGMASPAAAVPVARPAARAQGQRLRSAGNEGSGRVAATTS